MSCYNVKNFIFLVLLNLIIKDHSNIVVSSYRLENNSFPLKYNLRIKVHLEENVESYEGQVKIKIKITEPSEKITLHSKVLQSITNLTVLDLSSKKEQNATFKFESAKDFLTVDLPYNMPQNSEIVLKIQYNSSLKRADEHSLDIRGFVITSYKEPDGTNENIISTFFSPFYARECFPCFDEPSFKAIFRIEVEHHEHYNAVSNMPVESRVKIKGTDKFVRTRFKETPKMSTYLVAIFVSKLRSYVVKNSTVPQTVYARRSKAKSEYLKFMTENLGKILQTFENLFQMPYSLPKLDHLVVPNYFAALECWGAIGYTENCLNDKFSQNFLNKSVLFHEVAHHYFGNLVTPKWWSFTWLKEGFAQFYQYEVEKLLFPNFENQIDEGIFYNQDEAFMEDLMGDKSSLNCYVELPNEIHNKFSNFQYLKGAAIIRMFKNAFGTETWNKGICHYLQINQYESTDPTDLHSAIQKAYNEDHPKNPIDIGKITDLWENRSGFPNISVSLNNGSLKLTQKNDVHPDAIYSIPITYSTSSDPNFNNLTTKFWMTTRTIEIRNFEDNWIVFNNQQIGYYKVTYDEILWNLIIDQLHANHLEIHWINRMALLESLSYDVKFEKLNASILLRMCRYLKNEENIEVIGASSFAIFRLFLIQSVKQNKDLRSELKIPFTAAYENFRHYNWNIIVQFIACHINVKNCVTDAINEMLLDFKNHGINIDPEKSYCNALQHANESIVEMFYDFREPIINKHKNHSFFKDINCIQNPKLFKKSLNIYFENDNHKRFPAKEPPYIDPVRLFTGWIMTDETVEGYISFLETNLKKLATESPDLLSDFLYYGRILFENDLHKKQLRKIKKNAQKINHKVNDDD